MNLRKKSLTLILCMLLCAVILAGCGRSLVITTGFGSGEVFRLGKTRGKVSEIRVYMLDLQKQSENYYGEAIWVSADSEKMQQAVKDQALAQLSRVKALGQIAISRNVMLTKLEEDLAVEAGKNYFAGLSEEEKKYLGLSEKELLNMMREYALAARMWKSLGDSAEDTYEQYYDSTQCDLNTKYWQKISLKRLEGDPSVPGFAECYASAFANVEYEVSDDEEDGSGSGEGAEAPAEAGSENADETGEASGGSEKTEQVSGEPADGSPEQDDAALKADDAAKEKAEEKAGAAENGGGENAQEQAEKPAENAQEQAEKPAEQRSLQKTHRSRQRSLQMRHSSRQKNLRMRRRRRLEALRAPWRKQRGRQRTAQKKRRAAQRKRALNKTCRFKHSLPEVRVRNERIPNARKRCESAGREKQRAASIYLFVNRSLWS